MPKSKKKIKVPDLKSPREPFQMSMNIEFTGPNANLPISVPAGKLLIVESASVLTRLPSGQRAHVQLTGNQNLVGTVHFSLNHQGTFSGREVWTAAESVRIYGNQGDSTTFFNMERSDGSTGKAWFEASLAGYLISVP
jgi:hypothetical protein